MGPGPRYGERDGAGIGGRGAGDEDERRCWMTFRRVSRQERVSDGSWGGRGVKAAAKQRAGQRGVPRGSRRAGKAASTLRR